MSDATAGWLVRWLTHDLASPIASVFTASELLSDTADAEINGLVQDGARHLVARLRLVRAVLASGDAPIGDRALEKLLRDGIAGTDIEFSRSDGAGHDAVLVGGIALLMADLRRGQTLTISNTAVTWATVAALPESVATALLTGVASDSRSALAAMLKALADRLQLTLNVTDKGIAFTGRD